jgi:arylsulfatase A-like enzyme
MVEIRHGDHDVTEGISSPLRSGATATGSTCGAPRRSSVPRPGKTCRFCLLQPFADAHAGDPREDFKGQTGHGDWADSLLELDTDFGALLDLLDLAGNTLVIFAGDNGPEEVLLWRGTPGYWEGSYFAGWEGNLRTPCIVRWPGHITRRAGQR